MSFLTPGQRRCVAELLHHILDTRAGMADHYLCSEDLLPAIEHWSDRHS
jgi:hypothetical protein